MAQAYVYEDDATGWRHFQNGDLPTSGVTAATYGDATHVGQFAVNAQGIITSASNVAVSGSSSPLTTKGDIFGYSTVDARIPVGSNDQVLIADSAQTLGVKWGAVPSGSGGALTLIGSQVLSSDGASMSVSSISGAYTVLDVFMLTRHDEASLPKYSLVQLNSDTTAANYVTELAGGAGASSTAVNITTSAGWSFQSEVSGSAANLFASSSFSIIQYASSSIHKVMNGLNQRQGSEAGGSQSLSFAVSGVWKSTSAITTVTVVTTSGVNLKAGSAIYVYGRS